MKLLLSLLICIGVSVWVSADCIEDNGYLGCPVVSTVAVETNDLVWREFVPGYYRNHLTWAGDFSRESYVYDLHYTTYVVIVANCDNSGPIKFFRKWEKSYHEITWLEPKDGIQMGLRANGLAVWRREEK